MRMSRFLRASLVAIALTTLPMTPDTASAVCGDVSGDQNITTFDALSVLRKAVGQNVSLVCDQCGDACEGDLRYLLGEWEFETDFDEILVDTYDLFAVDEVDCLIVGQDLDDGGIVFASDAFDAGYDFVLLDPSDTYCDFFFFDRVDANTVQGFDVLLDVDENGCADEISGIEYDMQGFRLASAAAAGAGTGNEAPEGRQSLIPPASLVAGGVLPPEFAGLLDKLQRRSVRSGR